MINEPLEIQLQQAIIDAMSLTQSRIEQYPKYNALQHAKKQLALITSLMNNPNTINEDSIASIDIGLMAVKEFDDSDPVYAHALHSVSSLLQDIVTKNKNLQT